METLAPSSVAKYDATAWLVLQLTRRLSAMRRLTYSLLLMITLFKLQVFETIQIMKFSLVIEK
jgi:hypothetical protein